MDVFSDQDFVDEEYGTAPKHCENAQLLLILSLVLILVCASLQIRVLLDPKVRYHPDLLDSRLLFYYS